MEVGRTRSQSQVNDRAASFPITSTRRPAPDEGHLLRPKLKRPQPTARRSQRRRL